LGLALTVTVFALLGFMVRGDLRLLLEEWGVSVDAFAIALHEAGLLIGLVVTLHFLLKREVNVSNLGMKNGFEEAWIAFAVAGFLVAMLLYLAIEASARVIGIEMFWWVKIDSCIPQ